MGNPEAVFDSDLFTRTASRFVMKRSAFPQTAVAALAGDVLHRLAGPGPAPGKTMPRKSAMKTSPLSARR